MFHRRKVDFNVLKEHGVQVFTGLHCKPKTRYSIQTLQYRSKYCSEPLTAEEHVTLFRLYNTDLNTVQNHWLDLTGVQHVILLRLYNTDLNTVQNH